MSGYSRRRVVARLGRGDRDDVSVGTFVDGVPAPLPVVRPLSHGNPELCGPLVYGVDIVDSDPDLRPARALTRLCLRERKDHEITGSEVSPSEVVMEIFVPIVPMRLAAQLQPDELSVELRRGGQVAGPNLQAGESCHTAESTPARRQGHRRRWQ